MIAHDWGILGIRYQCRCMVSGEIAIRGDTGNRANRRQRPVFVQIEKDQGEDTWLKRQAESE